MKRNIIFTPKLYNTDDVERNASFYKWRLLHGVGKCDIYFIVLSECNEELSDETPLVIAGMSKTKEGAIAVISSLVTIMARDKMSFDFGHMIRQVGV